MGEADAIRIVDGRGSRTFKRYLILTDDRPAQARAGSLGMGPLDVAEFLLTANGAGLATAGRAADAPDAPEASGYRLGEGVRERFTRSLV